MANELLAPPVELIEWIDHHSFSEWNDISEIAAIAKRLFVIRNVGFLVYEDEMCVVVAAEATSDRSVAGTREYKDATCVMKVLIRKRITLEGRCLANGDCPNSGLVARKIA